jgi:hypothetical protein
MDYHIFTPLIPFIIGIILKTILDFKLGPYMVKWLHWIPVRSIFRMKVENIAGEWKQVWSNTLSERYPAEQARTSKMIIKQFGSFVYGEFRANNDEEYYIYGELIGRNIVGKWRDRKNDLGYFGAFEVRIINNAQIHGLWCGHSNVRPEEIYTDHWDWVRQ